MQVLGDGFFTPSLRWELFLSSSRAISLGEIGLRFLHAQARSSSMSFMLFTP